MEWDKQFAETADERAERWRQTKARRKAEGKCWQCAKMIAECQCPNVKHSRTAANETALWSRDLHEQ